MLFYPGTNCQIRRVGKGRNRKKIKIDYKFRHCISCGERKKIGAVVATTYNKILHNYCENCYILYREQFKGIEKLGLKLVISRNIKKKEKDNMTEIIWTYDTKKATERSESLSKLHKEYFESSSEKEIEERLKKYDGGTVIVSKSIEVDNGFSDTKEVHIFTAVLKNGKIGIFLDDGFYEEHLFCDYLRSEDELDLFFDSIDIRSNLIDSQYRKDSKNGFAEHIYVGFDIYEIINNGIVTVNFSDGIWICNDWGNEDKYPGWELDVSASDRGTMIKEIKDYMERYNQ